MEMKSMESTPTNNSTKKIIAIVIGIAIIGGGLITYTASQNASTQKSKDNETAMKKEEDVAMMKKKDEGIAMMKKEEKEVAMKKEEETGVKATETVPSTTTPTTSTSPVTKTSVGTYVAYSADLAKSAAVDGTSVIFFHAPWCPTCKAAESDINANISKLDPKLTILKTDYDTSTELKKQYGVTTQSTFVKVDKDGKLIKKGTGFTTVSAINAFANS
jgi:thiol-disulfide isomerase/thioredoxin